MKKFDFNVKYRYNIFNIIVLNNIEFNNKLNNVGLEQLNELAFFMFQISFY